MRIDTTQTRPGEEARAVSLVTLNCLPPPVNMIPSTPRRRQRPHRLTEVLTGEPSETPSPALLLEGIVFLRTASVVSQGKHEYSAGDVLPRIESIDIKGVFGHCCKWVWLQKVGH